MRQQKTLTIGDVTVIVNEMTVADFVKMLKLIPQDLNILNPGFVAGLLENGQPIINDCVTFSDGSTLMDCGVSSLITIYDAFMDLHRDFFGQVRARILPDTAG